MHFLPLKADADNPESSPHVTATAVTTRTAMMTEDKEKNEKTSQVCTAHTIRLIHCVILNAPW